MELAKNLGSNYTIVIADLNFKELDAMFPLSVDILYRKL